MLDFPSNLLPCEFIETFNNQFNSLPYFIYFCLEPRFQNQVKSMYLLSRRS